MIADRQKFAADLAARSYAAAAAYVATGAHNVGTQLDHALYFDSAGRFEVVSCDNLIRIDGYIELDEGITASKEALVTAILAALDETFH